MTVHVPKEQLSLEQLAGKIRADLEAMDKADQSALIHAMNAGGKLKLAKLRCQKERKPWNKWVPANFNRTKQMADNYIRLFDYKSEINAETTRTGKGMTVSEAIAFLAKSEQPDADDQEKPTSKKQKVRLTDQQQEALQSFLEARSVQADPVSFMSTLADLDINLKKIVNRLDILAIELKEQKFSQWINSFQDGYPAWEDACQPYGVEPELLAWAAKEANLGVYGYFEEAEESLRPSRDYDTLIAGGQGWYYFVRAATFRTVEIARKAAEELAQPKHQEIMDEDVYQNLRRLLASLADDTSLSAAPLEDATPPTERAAKPKKRKAGE